MLRIGVAVVPSVLLMSKRAVKTVPVLAGSKSLNDWLAIAWNAQRAQPAFLAKFVICLLKR